MKDESNWVARIEAPDGGRSINIPGCQVQAVLQGEFGAPGEQAWTYVL